MSLNHSVYEFDIEGMVDKYRWRFNYVPVGEPGVSPAGILSPYYPDNKMGEEYNNAVAEILGTSYGYRVVSDWMMENPGQPFICFRPLFDCLLDMGKRVGKLESPITPGQDEMDYMCGKFLELGKHCYEILHERDLHVFDGLYDFEAEREYEDNTLKRSLHTLRRDLLSGEMAIGQIPEDTKIRILEDREVNYEFLSKIGLTAGEHERLKGIAEEMRKQLYGEEPAPCSCSHDGGWER